MKKIFYSILLLLLLVSCKNREIINKDSAIKNKEKDIVFKNEVLNLKSSISPGKIELTWELPEIGDIESIEILKKQTHQKKFRKIKTISAESTSFETKLRAFIDLDFQVKLISKDGLISEGKSIRARGIHKDVVFEEFKGRKMQIYLPPSYKENSDKTYPVVYMQDGQNLFDKSTAAANEWKVDEVMNELISKDRVEEMIVVGIYSMERSKEYTPYESHHKYHEELDPQAKEYGEFLVKELLPYVEGKYRIKQGRENRAVMGSSLGGIFSFWLGFEYPDIFSYIGAFSSTFWIGDGKIFDRMEKMEKHDMSVFFFRGTREWTLDSRKMIKILEKKGYKYKEDLAYIEGHNMAHTEEAWTEILPSAFIFFKGKEKKTVENIEINVSLNPRWNDNWYLDTNINPVITYDNGLKISEIDKVEYRPLNPDYIDINEDGFFEMKKIGDYEIEITAKDYQDKIKFNHQDIKESLKGVIVDYYGGESVSEDEVLVNIEESTDRVDMNKEDFVKWFEENAKRNLFEIVSKDEKEIRIKFY